MVFDAIVLSSAFVLTLATVSVERDAARFREVCRKIAPGTDDHAAKVAFSSITHRMTAQAGRSPAHPSPMAFFRRCGFARNQQCTIDLTAGGKVTRVVYTDGTDFDRCVDPTVYPRRWWLCTIASRMTP